jgi:NodT family efflux transporter outer membrane factor (OMF) lipoprotein
MPGTAIKEPRDLAAWWKTFNDPLLTELIARATSKNLEVIESVARLTQAREALIQARADELPSLTGSIGATRNYTQNGASNIIVGSGSSSTGGAIISTVGGGTITELSTGLDASWQADIFGGLHRTVEAALATQNSSRFDLESVRTSVAAETATNYINIRLAQARLAIARQTVRAQDENLQIALWREQAGLVSALDVEQARVQRAQTAATIPSLQISFTNAVNRIGVLTGQAPGALRETLAVPLAIPRGPDTIGLGVPADTLRMRPDVRSAERQLAAATARIGVAKAQLYPALTISGNISSAAATVGGLGGALTGSLFSGLTQTIFDGGRQRSQVRSARAGAELALATYKLTILNGLEDVENSSQALQSAHYRQAELQVAVEAADAAVLYARSQYSSGFTDFLTLLQSEQSLLSARDALASSQADQSLAAVQLYLALGGGWEPSASTHSDRRRDDQH